MENDPFIDGLPMKNGDFPWRTVSHYQMVNGYAIPISPKRRLRRLAEQPQSPSPCCGAVGWSPCRHLALAKSGNGWGS